MTSAAVSGFLLGFSLIVAIGAQNAFVLRQGLLRAHVFPVALTCALSDAILIAIGVAGFGWLVEEVPWLIPVTRWGGAAFLVVYGLMALRSAWTGAGALRATRGETAALGPTLLTCLVLTWGNPHVYLDTVVLLGSVAAGWDGARVHFGLGAITASFVFFFGLAYGARILAPVFSRPVAWRVLDALIAVVMLSLAVKVAT